MKIRFIFLLFLVIFSLVDSARSSAETDLKRLIEGLQNRYGRMKGLTADFLQVYQDRAGRSLREQGILILKRPGKMRWEYREPKEKLFIIDDKKVYFYVPSDHQVTITTLKEVNDPRVPFLFLLGRGNLQRDFAKIEISQTESPTAAGHVVLELVPKRSVSNLKRIFAEVNEQTLQLRRLAFIDNTDARSDFLLSNYQENYQANDDLFTFTPPPGVRILK
ncbi:MAG: outer membrane lipoprotein chaperone LolA [Acidobacteriota bacterium]